MRSNPRAFARALLFSLALLVGAILAFQARADEVWLNDPQIDAQSAAITAIDLGAPMQAVRGGRVNTPGASTVGVRIPASTAALQITGFQCRNFETAPASTANCIVATYPFGNYVMVRDNPNSTLVPAYAQTLNQFPTGTTSASATFMGIGRTITPALSSFVDLVASANIYNATGGNGAKMWLAYGTGTTPTNGQACSTGGGTTVSGTSAPAEAISSANNEYAPASLKFSATMTPGTQYWVDICLAVITSGTATARAVDIRATEMVR